MKHSIKGFLLVSLVVSSTSFAQLIFDPSQIPPVTNSMLAPVASQTVKGRLSGGNGTAEDITATQLRTLINVVEGAHTVDTNASTICVNATDLLQGDGNCVANAGSGAVEGTAVLSTGEVGGSKFLREDGDGTSSWQAITGGGDALTSSPLSQFATTTAAQLNSVLSGASLAGNNSGDVTVNGASGGNYISLIGQVLTVDAITRNDILDFDAEVSNNAAVVANTAKVSNATHTGDVAGSTVLNIAALAVGTTELAAAGVTNAKLANDSVTAAKIGTGQVGSDELASTAVTAGAYTSANFTVDADGRITSAANGSGGGARAVTSSTTAPASCTYDANDMQQYWNSVDGDMYICITGDVWARNMATLGLANLSDIVSATNTNNYVLTANGTTGYVGRQLLHANLASIGASDHHVKTVDTNTNAQTICTNATDVLQGDGACVANSGGAAPVDSVNGLTGVVVLDPDDLNDALTVNRFTSTGDINKLLGIEANATTDQTGAQIKASYENEANTNAFTDAEKTLLGNQSGVNSGDVTVADTSTINQTLSGQSLFATVIAGSIGAPELAATSVTAGAYTSTNITVDADGRITAASNGTGGSAVTYTESFVIRTATTTSDYRVKAASALTLTALDCVATGATTPAAQVMTVMECTSAAGSCVSSGGTVTLAALTTNYNDSTFTDAAIASGAWWGLDTTSLTTAADLVACTVSYTQ